MGATDRALESDAGVEIALVLAIEGYENLIVSRQPASAVAAWAGTDWEAAVSGLTVRGSIEQSYEPFGNPIVPSRLSFVIEGQGGDTVGADFFNRSTDAQTELTADVSETDTAISVISTDQFNATGTIYLGGERIDYLSRTGTAFFRCIRGKYAPFKALTEANQRFGMLHRIETDDLGVISPPEVTARPRQTAGKRCGLWVHRIVGGVWDTRAEARLDFAGRILEVSDDPSGALVITAEDIRGDLRNSVIGLGMYRATVDPRVYIEADTTVSVVDYTASGGNNTSGVLTLTFVDGSPGTDEAAAGYYHPDELVSTLSKWFGDIYDASDTEVRRTISGTEQLTLTVEIDSGTGHSTNHVFCDFRSSGRVWEMLGFVTSADDSNSEEFRIVVPNGTGDREQTKAADVRAWKLNLRPEFNGGISLNQASRNIGITRRAGTWYNNAATAPAPWRELFANISSWGFARIGKYLGPVEFVDENTVRVLFPADSTGFSSFLMTPLNPREDNLVEANEFGEIIFEQVIAIEGKFTDLLRQIIQSVDGNQYNESTWDNYPRQLAAAIPGELASSRFDESVSHVNGTIGTDSLVLVIEKPTSLLELFESDLLIRQAFFVFEDGELQLSTFSSATSALAHHILTESTKATPGNQTGETRTPIRMSTEFLTNNIKLSFGRRSLSSSEYASELEIRAQPSIDAFGSSRPITIKMRNLFEGQRSSGDIIESFAREIVDRILPLFSQPVAQIEVPISFNRFHMVPGDTVSVTDSHARNPDTGTRGITAMCGTVMSVSHSWGGNGEHWSGKAVVLLFDRDRFATYSPAARVDSSHTTGNFTAGYSATDDQLKLLASEYSGSGAFVGGDVSYFQGDDRIRVIEVDPTPGTEPQYWDVNVNDANGSTNIMEIDATLTGFDSTKEYRVISQPFLRAQSEQAVECYLATRGDGLIQDVKRAREFSRYSSPPRSRYSNGAALVEASSADDLREYIPRMLLEDGAPVTPALESSIARLVDSVLEVSTAPCMPVLYDADVSVGVGVTGNGYFIFDIIKFYVGRGTMAQRPGEYRPIILAPAIRSTTGGRDAELRVRSSMTPPVPANVVKNLDVAFRPPTSAPLTFTTSSTTLVTATAQKLRPIYSPVDGYTYLIVEGRDDGTSYATAYRGMAELRMGAPEATP